MSGGDVSDEFYLGDDGGGFLEAKREAVFQAGSSTAATGTGVGSRIVSQIIEARGWD